MLRDVNDEAVWERVGQRLEERMAEIPISLAALSRTAQVSDTKLRQIVRGRPGNYRDETLRKVSKGVGWKADGIHAILNGGEPTVELDLAVSGFADEEWRRAGAALRAQRNLVGFDLPEVVHLSGVPRETWEAVESGEIRSCDMRELARMASAVDWPTDAILRVLAGASAEDPDAIGRNLEHDLLGDRVGILEREVAELKQQMEEMLAHLRRRPKR
jgi:hypothetical protein